MKKLDINSEEIARLAGVSRSTVSRVINNYANVPPKTREKVMKVIEQYNYYPNLSAQVLAGKRSRTIGLFMIDTGRVSGDFISNLLLASVIESASSKGYYVLTHIIRDTKDAEAVRSVKECFYQKRVDGGVFIGAANHEPLVEELIADGFLIAIVDHFLAGRTEPNRIVFNIDNEAGAEKAVDYLVSLGHTRIGAINGDMKRYAGPAKYDGFRRAMQKHGLPLNEDWIVMADFNEESGYRAAQHLIRNAAEWPTALFAANDSVAFGAIRAFHEHGIRVPDDISVIGFDDHSLSARHQPALTTIRVDFGGMMEQLTRTLIRAIENGPQPFRIETVETTLVVRDSCKRLAAGG